MRDELPAQVLKVAHHGSGTSSSPSFLAGVNPQVAIISVGAENDFGHPAPRTLHALEESRSKCLPHRPGRHGRGDRR